MRSILFLFMFSMSSVSISAEISGLITSIKVPTAKKLVLFELTSDEKGADCASTGWFAINTNRPGGANQYQLILEAKHKGLIVKVATKSDESCSEEPGVSSIRSISIGHTKSEMPLVLPSMIEEIENKINKSKEQ